MKHCKHCNQEIKRENFKKTHHYNIATFCSRKCYQDSRQTGVRYAICDICKINFKMHPSQQTNYCSDECRLSANRTIVKRTVLRIGYVQLKIGLNYYKEHIYLMEQLLKRKLLPNEVVHHIDGNRANNLFTNLQLMNRSEHSTLHLKGQPRKKGTYPIL